MRGLTSTLLSFLIALPSTSHASPPIDVGVFPDLDANIAVTLSKEAKTKDARCRVDARHKVVVLYEQDFPLKAYSLTSAVAGNPKPADLLAALDQKDAAEVAPFIKQQPNIELSPKGRNASDADDDGIPNSLDVLMGARKLVANHAAYTEGYYRIPFPMGDVPRNVGVCTDTIIRAYRNAGLDLQRLVAQDIQKAPASYPAIKKPDTNIVHRRVKTILIWFRRHMQLMTDTTPRPGDVVFLDTFPARPGPDHVGIISDRLAPSGLPFVINNWTVGYQESEMDLLPSIPVTHRFRLQ